MRLRSLCLAAVLAAIAGLTGAGCGDDEPQPAPPAAETVDELPKLPPAWKSYVNYRAGFAFGLAPGWEAKDRGTSTILSSPDELVAVSISADRTNEAVEFPLDGYALGAVEALPGFSDLEAQEPRPFDARYEAEAVKASGVTDGGVRQRLLFIAMRRGELATFAVLIARNVEQRTGFYAREALRIARTLRGRPVA